MKVKRILAGLYLLSVGTIVLLGTVYAASLLVLEALRGNPDAQYVLKTFAWIVGLIVFLIGFFWALSEVEP